MSFNYADIENYLYENYLGRCIAVEFTSGDCSKKAIGILEGFASDFIRLVSNNDTCPFIKTTVMTRNNPPLEERSKEIIIKKNNITSVELEPYFDNTCYRGVENNIIEDNCEIIDEASRIDAKTDPKTDAKTDVKTDPKTDPKTEPKTDPKTDYKKESKTRISENLNKDINENPYKVETKAENKSSLPQTDEQVVNLLREIEETAHLLFDEKGNYNDKLAKVNFLTTNHGSMFFKTLLPGLSDSNDLDDTWVEDLDDLFDCEKY